MLEILRPGVQTSVQDRGRRGLRHLGIAQAGALDMPALYRANSLLGNDPDAAGLEITLGPVSVRFGRDAWLALMTRSAKATPSSSCMRCPPCSVV